MCTHSVIHSPESNETSPYIRPNLESMWRKPRSTVARAIWQSRHAELREPDVFPSGDVGQWPEELRRKMEGSEGG